MKNKCRETLGIILLFGPMLVIGFGLILDQIVKHPTFLFIAIPITLMIFGAYLLRDAV